MIARAIAWLGGLATVAALITYGIVVHQYSIADDRSGASYLVASLSIFAVAGVAAFIKRAWWTLLVLAIVTGAAGYWIATAGEVSPTWVYLFQHAGSNGALAVFFLSTLRPGREPIISRLARMVHGSLEPERVHYTRQVTLAWAIFFTIVTVTSLALFATGQMLWWSWLANLLSLPLIAAMFIGEYLVRLVALRHLDHVGISAGATAWQRLRKPNDSTERGP